METMKNYTIYCTEEQTLRAYKLGAPIEKHLGCDISIKFTTIVERYGDSEWGFFLTVPTTQQMRG